VISVDEEYAYLRTGGMQMKNQALVQSAKGPVDAMTVTDEDGNTQVIHFNVAMPFAALTKQLSGGQ
jgi:hypothetical protein